MEARGLVEVTSELALSAHHGAVRPALSEVGWRRIQKPLGRPDHEHIARRELRKAFP
jgi:hypothetical protein